MNIEDKVCLNHTDTQAASRCTTCFKPICDQCIISFNSEDFCSETCRTNHERTSGNIDEIESRGGGGFFKKIIFLAILGGLAYGAFMYKDQIMKMIGQ